jgi:hypothetical protein
VFLDATINLSEQLSAWIFIVPTRFFSVSFHTPADVMSAQTTALALCQVNTGDAT